MNNGEGGRRSKRARRDRVTAIRALVPLLALAIVAATSRGAAPDDEPIPIAVSIAPIGWLVEQIAGDRVEIQVLVPPGSSPESYAPTDAQVSRLMRARAFVRIGAPFERGRWFEAVRRSGRLRIVDASKGIAMREMEGHAHRHDDDDEAHAHHEHGPDPHIWLAPRLLAIQAATIAEGLIALDPDRRAVYERRLEDLRRRLGDLDGRMRTLLEPCRGRALFVFHPAWGYLTDEYGLRQVAIEIDGKQPADAELTSLQQQARREGARVIFVQPQNSGRAARAVADAIGARVETIDPLAPDLERNLLHVARRLAAALGPARPEGP